MPRIVVAGSENDTRVAIIDFTTPTAATARHVDPGFAAGTRVALDGTKAVAGSVLTGNVRMIDVTNPAAPVLQGTVNTMLAGIGAIAIRGTLVAVGEYVNSFQARVKLLDFSAPMAPTVLGTASIPLTNVTVPNPDNPADTSAAIGSIAFLDDFTVVVSGPSDTIVVQINFAVSPANVTNFNSVLDGGLSTDADSGANRIVVGDQNGTQVKLFDSGTKALLATANTTLGGVGSLALNMPRAFAGSPNDFIVARVDFSGAAPAVTPFNGGLGGGVTTAIEGSNGAGGAILGTNVALYNLGPETPTTLGTANSGLASISTLAMSTTTGGPPPGPHFAVLPAMLAFGPRRVSSSNTLSLVVTNSGGAPLTMTNIHSTDARFKVAPTGTQSIAASGGTLTINVMFTPNAEAVFDGAIACTTNDPGHVNVSIPLAGTGALPHINVESSFNVGTTPACFPRTANLNVQNSGGIGLHVTAATAAPFSVMPANLTVPAGSTLPLAVQFTPPGPGTVGGMLNLTTDDPTHPTLSVTLSATAVAAPPALAVTPPALVFGDVPVQFFIGLRLSIANSSPCELLNVTLTSSGDPFFVTGTDPTTVPPSSTTISHAVPPSATRRFVVVFAPTTTATSAGTLTITSDDPQHVTTIVPLSGGGVQLLPAAMELVLDRSFSMQGPAQGGTKIEGLRAAVHLFSDLVITGRGDEMGSVEFDDAAQALTPFGPYDDAKRSTIQHDADLLEPRNYTSIGGGIEQALTEMGGTALARKVMLVFTDGKENKMPSIAAAKMMLPPDFEIYAVALGHPQNISTSSLSDLAVSSNGRFFISDDTLILRKNFVQVLADAYRLNMAADPLVDLPAGGALEVPVEITECEHRISFIVNWDDPASEIELTVIAPDGTIFNAASPASNRLVHFGDRPRYRFCQIAFPTLDPGPGAAVIGPAQIGTWRMRLRAQDLAGTSERCTTSVLVESDLKIRSHVAPPALGAPLHLVTQLLHRGDLIEKDAEVRLTITSPTVSLAAVSTPAVVAAALNADRAPIPAGEGSLIATTTDQFMLDFNKRRKGYTTQLPVPEVDGVYTFEVEARGKQCSGTFERYETFSLYIGRRPHGRQSKVSIQSVRGNLANIVIDLRDLSGEPLGPGNAGFFVASLKGGTVWPVVDQGDGTYVLRATWSPRLRKPVLRIAIGDVKWKLPLPTAKHSPH